jgi:hypothetical protein
MSENEGSGESMLLEPEKKGLGGILLPAALAAGGAALIYNATRKSEKKASKKFAPVADPNEVVFSSSYGSYALGRDYERLILEAYLSEQAEAGNLALRGEQEPTVTDSLHQAMIEKTRNEVISAFKSTHYARVGKEKVQISALPQDKTGVQKFNAWLEKEVKSFQETY